MAQPEDVAKKVIKIVEEKYRSGNSSDV